MRETLRVLRDFGLTPLMAALYIVAAWTVAPIPHVARGWANTLLWGLALTEASTATGILVAGFVIQRTLRGDVDKGVERSHGGSL